MLKPVTNALSFSICQADYYLPAITAIIVGKRPFNARCGSKGYWVIVIKLNTITDTHHKALAGTIFSFECIMSAYT